jgi:hypothetical protein
MFVEGVAFGRSTARSGLEESVVRFQSRFMPAMVLKDYASWHWVSGDTVEFVGSGPVDYKFCIVNSCPKSLADARCAVTARSADTARSSRDDTRLQRNTFAGAALGVDFFDSKSCRLLAKSEG